ncbi:hypothetical protein Hsc_0836 [Herbaspirillum seropedicae]|nr:hypothetical protein Hsc_0836 [Herbaspirillum seropedicae]
MRSKMASKRATVHVQGTAMEIWVAPASHSTWRAWGFFKSTHIETSGTTLSDATTAWKIPANQVRNPG